MYSFDQLQTKSVKGVGKWYWTKNSLLIDFFCLDSKISKLSDKAVSNI